eukprot:GHVO01069774.1.p1 GENE.GHVO01069774.1~~GHVO01069774.1.p1  ORF type:complete len:359 (+),score=27.31 GHVO01069774.1:257-1333(+)
MKILSLIFYVLFYWGNADPHCINYGDDCIACYTDQACGGCYGPDGFPVGPLECMSRLTHNCDHVLYGANSVTECSSMCTGPGEAEECQAATFCSDHQDCAPCVSDMSCGGCYDTGDLVCISRADAANGHCNPSNFKTADTIEECKTECIGEEDDCDAGFVTTPEPVTTPEDVECTEIGECAECMANQRCGGCFDVDDNLLTCVARDGSQHCIGGDLRTADNAEECKAHCVGEEDDCDAEFVTTTGEAPGTTDGPEPTECTEFEDCVLCMSNQQCGGCFVGLENESYMSFENCVGRASGNETCCPDGNCDEDNAFFEANDVTECNTYCRAVEKCDPYFFSGAKRMSVWIVATLLGLSLL